MAQLGGFDMSQKFMMTQYPIASVNYTSPIRFGQLQANQTQWSSIACTQPSNSQNLVFQGKSDLIESYISVTTIIESESEMESTANLGMDLTVEFWFKLAKQGTSRMPQPLVQFFGGDDHT